MSSLPKIIIIAGPTAVGKTQFACDAAKKFNGEIINADSRQFYTEMSVGTAKPSQEEQSQCRFHLIDCASVLQPWTVADFVEHAEKKIDELTRLKKMPFIVGGTGMYLKALLYGLDPVPVINSEIATHLQNKLQNHTVADLYNELCQSVPQTVDYITKNNTQRVLRALGVYLQTGRGIHEFWQQQEKKYDVCFVVLNADRKILYEKIDARVLLMIHQGLKHEAQKLFQRYPQNPLLNKTIGYAEWQQIGFDNEDDVIKKIQQNSRHFAKRQLTWFRGQEDAQFFDMQEQKNILRLLDAFCTADN